jgi:hypothetical protein
MGRAAGPVHSAASDGRSRYRPSTRFPGRCQRCGVRRPPGCTERDGHGQGRRCGRRDRRDPQQGVRQDCVGRHHHHGGANLEVDAATWYGGRSRPPGARPPNGWGGNLPDPDTCFGSGESYGLGPGPVNCWSAKIFEPGASSQVTFHLKITQVIAKATGTVELTRDSEDSESGDDKASVIINPGPVDTVAGVPVTRPIVLGGALLLLVLGGGLLHLRARRQVGVRNISRAAQTTTLTAARLRASIAGPSRGDEGVGESR